MKEESTNLTEVHLDLPNHWWRKGESLWARPLGDDLYEIENVPFCAYGLNYGDVVRAVAASPDLKPEVQSVVSHGGNQTLRVIFKVPREEQGTFIGAIEAMRAEIERADSTFICINIPPVADFAAIREYLDEQGVSGTLAYETCEARVAGSFDDVAPEKCSSDEA
ncbi:MAG TPA: DUF4265 domain-containing protein [Variovorax sp.]|nr:DUF4265 domain-containing protein [Variovorax sp.]